MTDENTSLQPGDVVMLKSGGPHMTVDMIAKFVIFDSVTEKHPKAKCSWFDGIKRCTEKFELHSLKKVE